MLLYTNSLREISHYFGKNILHLFLSVLLLSMIVFPAMGAQLREKPPSHLIIAFGDSLTAGYGISLTEAYPALLEKRLKTMGFSYKVLNGGISADTTSGGLSRINEIIKQNPGIVILELGANDGLRGTSLDLIKSNLSRMIERLQKKKIKVILAGMRLPPNYGEEYTEGFHQIYIDLSKQYHLRFIPFFLEGVATKEGLTQTDGLHPTAEGYQVVLENVWKELLPLLSKGNPHQNRN
jgi:acyl-CoA thioesterase-1